jgi:hypothetical protein
VDDAVAVEIVALSRVCVEVSESGGENELPSRLIWLIEGVVKERGSVDDGRRPEDGLSALGVRCVVAGIASVLEGGIPLYNSAYTWYPRMN